MKIASFHLSWQKHSSGERCFPVSLKKMPKTSKQQNKSCHQLKSSCASSYQKFNMSQNTLYFLKVLVQKLRKILLYFDGMLLQSAWMKILRIFILSAFMLNISKQAICGKLDFWMYDFYLLDLATRHLELQIHHMNIISLINTITSLWYLSVGAVSVPQNLLPLLQTLTRLTRNMRTWIQKWKPWWGVVLIMIMK